MFNQLTIKKAHKGLISGEFSARELAEECILRIKERQKEINSFITITEDIAIDSAIKVDEKLKNKQDIGLLEGIPCGIKDNILVKDVLCTSGSKILSNYKAVYNATIVEKLESYGYVLAGKTNMDEFAMGSSTEHSYFGVVKNPRNTNCVPGGSSGGSAAAVADNQVIYALGSDTGGSIRQPAALCGIVGFKPTYGRISRYGLMPMASSFDQIGPLTKNVEDSALIFDHLYGHDKKDATSVNLPEKENFLEIKEDIKGMKIGYDPDLFIEGMDYQIKDAVMRALDRYKENGAEIIEVSMPNLKYALAAYYILMPAEASSNLARFDGIRYGFSDHEAKNLEQLYKNTRSKGFGEEVKRRILLGTYVLSHGYYDAYYKKAQKVRSLIIKDYDNAFKKINCLITPTTPSVAFEIGQKLNDPLTMYLEDIYTVSLNVAGVPGISIPIENAENGLPIGMQIIAKHYDEKNMFKAANAYEKIINN